MTTIHCWGLYGCLLPWCSPNASSVDSIYTRLDFSSCTTSFFTNPPCHSLDYSSSCVYLVLINLIMASTFSCPFSTSFSPPPHTSKQWKFVLQRVKLLYAQRQYKQCAAQVEDILMTAREPVSVLNPGLLG